MLVTPPLPQVPEGAGRGREKRSLRVVGGACVCAVPRATCARRMLRSRGSRGGKGVLCGARSGKKAWKCAEIGMWRHCPAAGVAGENTTSRPAVPASTSAPRRYVAGIQRRETT